MTAIQPLDYNKLSSDADKLISFLEDTQNFLIMILERSHDFKNLNSKEKKTLQNITYPIIEEIGSMRVAVSGKSEDKIFKEKLSQSNLTKNSLADKLSIVNTARNNFLNEQANIDLAKIWFESLDSLLDELVIAVPGGLFLNNAKISLKQMIFE
jgi:hypothetical protein